MRYETELIGAEVDINRAVFEMNGPGEIPPRESELRYVMLCVARAHHCLMRCYVALEEKGVRPFSPRELKQWERSSHKPKPKRKRAA